MSNRDGKDAKPRKSKTMWLAGKRCPVCRKGRLEKAECCGKAGHEHHIHCKTCNTTNF